MRSKTLGFILTLAFIMTGGILFSQADVQASDFPDVELRGRFHMDAGFYKQDETKLDNGFNNRRTRMGIRGKLAPDWNFVMEYDFAEEGTSANDVVLTGNIGPGTLKIGHFKVPMGLNELTSSNNITFMERASNSNIVADSRKLGAGYDFHAPMFGVQTMVFGRGMGDKEEGDMPIGGAGRFYVNPLSGDMLVHLGASAAYMNYKEGTDYTELRFRDRPEVRADSATRLIDTEAIDEVDNTIKAGVEAAFQYGPLSIEGEYLMVKVNRFNGDEPTFAGYHIQASYILTGESRGYRNGVFRGVSPQNDYGALEVAARYSSVDLNDSNFAGGKQDNITLGMNYYANNNVRFMFNYILINVDYDNGGDETAHAFAARAQYNF